MARLQLTLLGGFEARIIPGEPLDIANRKTRALLAYLALPTGRAHSRDKLTALLGATVEMSRPETASAKPLPSW